MGSLSEGGGKRGLGCFAVVAVVAVLGAAGQAFYGSGQPDKPVTPEEQAERDAFRRIQGAKLTGERVVRSMLKDPSSAEFGETLGRVKHGQLVACGHVNARNSFGGMAGAQPWVVLVDQNVALVRSMSSARRFDETWNRYCTGDADEQ